MNYCFKSVILEDTTKSLTNVSKLSHVTSHGSVRLVWAKHDEHEYDEYAPFMIMAHLEAIKRWFN